LDYADAEAAEIAAQIREYERQEANLIYMSLAAITTKKASTAKQKVLKSLKESAHNLRNVIEKKKANAPDIFDMMRKQAQPKANDKKR